MSEKGPGFFGRFFSFGKKNVESTSTPPQIEVEKPRTPYDELNNLSVNIQQLKENTKNLTGDSLESAQENIKQLEGKERELKQNIAGVNIESEMSPETETIKLVQNIVKGEYLLSKEIKKGNLKSGAVVADLENILGKENFTLDEKGNITKLVTTQKEKDIEASDKKEQRKQKIRGLIKGILGVGLAAGGILGAAAALPFLPALFGIGGALASRGVVEFVRGLRIGKEKGKLSLRAETEKNDWQKYNKMLEMAKDVETNGYSADKVVELLTFIKSSEEESFKKHSEWRKDESKWKKLEVMTGVLFGAVGSVGGFLYAKHALLEEVMKKAVDFDLDFDGITHKVMKAKEGFVYLYESATEPLEIAKKLGTEKYLDQLTKLDYGTHGAHLFNPQEQVDVANRFQNLFNKEYYSGLKTCLAGTQGLILGQFLELLGLKKPEQINQELVSLDQMLQKEIVRKEYDDNLKAGREKLANEVKAQEEKDKKEFDESVYAKAEEGKQYIMMIKTQDEKGKEVEKRARILLKKKDINDKGPFAEIEILEIDGVIPKDNQEIQEPDFKLFNDSVKEKWEHPNYTFEQWKVHEEKTNKSIIDKINKKVKSGMVKIGFVNAAFNTNFGDDKYKIESGVQYYIKNLNDEENTVTIYKEGDDRDNVKEYKLTNLITLIDHDEANWNLAKVEEDAAKKAKSEPKKSKKKTTDAEPAEEGEEETTEEAKTV